MSKISKQVDQQQLQHQSDSDLSLQLSDASSLSSDSDLSDAQVKKKTAVKKKSTKKTLNKKKKVKDDSQYCTCRKGYDGKEFMIECDGCQGNKRSQKKKKSFLLIIFSCAYRMVSWCLCWIKAKFCG